MEHTGHGATEADTAGFTTFEEPTVGSNEEITDAPWSAIAWEAPDECGNHAKVFESCRIFKS